jgi:predicted metal-dependent phosphoesterase TrpH
MNNIQNLHCHTTVSDGELNYLEVLKVCKKNKVSVVAFTDHDSLPGKKEIELILKNKNHPVKWIIGVELSSGLPKDFGEEFYGGFDIIGLFTDPTNRKLADHCQKAQDARLRRMDKMVTNLKGLGFEISVEDCLKASGGEAVGRPHILKALRTKESNLKVIEGLRLKMEEDSLKDPNLKKKYDLMIRFGEEQYPYSLFLSKDSYIPNIYVERDYWLDMDQNVKLIREAGGLAFVAHYFTVVNKLPPEALDKIVRGRRIDGLETVFGRNLYGTPLEETIARCRTITKDLVEKYHCLETGGDDSHNEQAITDFANNQEFSKATAGMAEKIIAFSKIDPYWSSLFSPKNSF